MSIVTMCFFFFSSRRRHTRLVSDWSSDVCSSDLIAEALELRQAMKEGRLNVNVEYQNQATEEIQESHLEIGRASCRERV